ncbi:MAG: O-antigen ligase family protein [Parcubacteria group bacterium]|nr:O-antigen ligase family protein [Parcubacteria group bacterium]
MKIVYAITITAVFGVLLTPLIVSDSLFFPFVVGKAAFFRILIEIAFFGWLLLALREPSFRARRSRILTVFFLFVAWMFLANIFAENLIKAFWGNFERMEGWVGLLHVFAFFVVVSATLSAKRMWHYFWFASLGVSAIVSLGSFFEVSAWMSVSGGGPFGNPTYLGIYALFHIFLGVYAFSDRLNRSRPATIFLSASLLLNIVTLFGTQTRGALLGLIIGVFIAISIVWIARYGISRETVVLIGAGAMLVIGIFTVSRLSEFRKYPVFSDIASISLEEGKTRFTIWRMALEGVKERPVFGWGQEGFNYVFNKYYEPSLFGQEEWFDRAHNSFLDWMVAGGLAAGALFVSLFWFLFRAVWLYEDAVIAGVVMIGLVVAFAVHSLFVFDNVVSSIMFATLLAYGHRVELSKSFFEKKVFGNAEPRIFWKIGNLSMARNFGIIAGAAIVLFLVAIFFFVHRPFGAALELGRALRSADVDIALSHFNRALKYNFGRQEISEQMILFSSRLAASVGVQDFIKVRVAQMAVVEMSKQVAKIPNDARAYVMRSIAYGVYIDTRNALLDLEKARQLSPRKQRLLLEQGKIAYAIGDQQAAARLFEQAYILDGSFNEIAAYAGAGLIAIGRISQGQAVLQKHFSTPFPDHPFVQRVYKDIK